MVLRQAGVPFEQVRPQLDEEAEKQRLRAAGLAPADQAMALSEAKARSVARTMPEAWVIGCDQMLLANGEVFDKPGDQETAATQLRTLRGQWHALLTGAVLLQGETVVWRCLDQPRLHMRAFSDDFLRVYLEVAGAGALASVGGYQLEGPGVQLFDDVQGDWFSILGLPLLPLLAELRRLGVLTE